MRHALSVRETPRATEALMAKLTFCGMSPVAEAISSALSLATHDANHGAVSVEKRAPLFPGWTGAEICKKPAVIGKTS